MQEYVSNGIDYCALFVGVSLMAAGIIGMAQDYRSRSLRSSKEDVEVMIRSFEAANGIKNKKL